MSDPLPDDESNEDELDYSRRSLIRLRDATVLAQKLQTDFAFRPPPAFPVIIDIGCGTGRSTLELAARFPNSRVIGLDGNPVYIERAPPLARNVEFYCVNIVVETDDDFDRLCTLTDLSSGSVDLAVSSYWLGSLEGESCRMAIAAIGRLLKANGQLHLLDLIWSQAHPVMYRLNQNAHWNQLIDGAQLETLPTSEHPPDSQDLTKHWLEILEPFPRLELFQIVRNTLHYRFESMSNMFDVLESICTSLEAIENDAQRHDYFVEFVLRLFDESLFNVNQLRLTYENLSVVIRKKTLAEMTSATTSMNATTTSLTDGSRLSSRASTISISSSISPDNF